jgi:argininosuccinate lyase
MAALTLMKGLPLTYNRDLQEDKEPVFDTVDTLLPSTRLLARMFPRIVFKAQVMKKATAQGHLLATDLADYLVGKGLDFRNAHRVVGEIVAYALKNEKELPQIPLALLQQFSPVFDQDVSPWLDLETSLARRDTPGGTAPGQVRKALKNMEKKLCRPDYPF